MLSTMDNDNLRTYAIMGIRAEIARLESALAALTHVREGVAEPPATADDRPRAPRAPMTAAAKARISRRMKAYWAGKRRAAK